LVDSDSRGDPMSPLRWTFKSTAQLALALTKGGHPVSADTVGSMLREAGYSLQANVKTQEGAQHPDRDAQFRYLQPAGSRVPGRRATGGGAWTPRRRSWSASSGTVGREWEAKGRPVPVRLHDFMLPELGKTIPYGVYAVARNVGWVVSDRPKPATTDRVKPAI
jgi:hypothetical protein